ncbi:MAG: tetratricopeptide repeat protein, partial [Verrucomicrobiota bacterium]|nr:tetratricopeptide repeat protein [Verrucomicrobiota bacterium]
EVFLKAYMTSQQGEKLEHDNQFKAALAKFRFAGSLLEELKKSHAEWQPAIVEYRSRKIGESILRVQNKIGTQADLAATSEPAAQSVAPLLPQNSGPAEPSVEIGAGTARLPVPSESEKRPAATPAIAAATAPSDAAIKKATKELQDKVDQLQAELQKSRSQITSVQKEKEAINGKLQDTNSKLEKAQADLQKAHGAEKTARDQLATAQESLKKIQTGGNTDAKASEALKAEIAQLKKALASAEQGRTAAEKEKDVANAKANDASVQIESVTKERDQLVADLKNSKQAADRVQALVVENSDLQKKLADAEKQVREISEDKPQKEQEVADVRRQVEQLKQQLASSQKQNQEFETTISELRQQLEDTNTQLAQAKTTGANPEETARLTKENDMLRAIVMRERQEEARREQAKRLMLAEFDKLQIKSETLNQQIELLAQPVTKLSAEELALLRQPLVATSDTNPSGVTASFAMAKPGAPASTPGPNVETTFKPSVPEELVPLARDAKANFDNGKFRAAEKNYDEILTKSPNNLYALSNLGAVYFRTGRLKAAELTLKKAVTLAPKDEFSRRTLGIVYYRQAKFDDAVTELTKALAINPKSFIAHNYLGITASEKGWQEAAEKEMLEAIAANPDYVDAHYNLAVIYATNKPPAKELAKRHYAKAKELGAESNPSLEKLIQ